MPITSAGLDALLDEGADASLYVGVGDGPAAGDQVSGERVQVTWTGPVDGVLTAAGLPYRFTGAASAAATHALFFSSLEGGTFYGPQPLDGDQVFNADGGFELSALTLTAADADMLFAPAAAFEVGTAVGAPTGVELTDTTGLPDPDDTEIVLLTHPDTGETNLIEAQVWRRRRWTTPNFVVAPNGACYLFDECAFEGAGADWTLEVDSTGNSGDIMQPLVILRRTTVDGGDTTDRVLSGHYLWLMDCHVTGGADGWQGAAFSVAERCNFIGTTNGDPEAHADGVQVLDTGHTILSQCWTYSPDNAAVRIGTEFGATANIRLLYTALGGGGWALQLDGDNAALTDVGARGCRFQGDHGFGPVDAVNVLSVAFWEDMLELPATPVPSP